LLGGLLGVGGGFVMIPLLVLWAKVPQHKANGTSLLAIIPIAIVGALVYYFQPAGGRPQVDLGFAFLLIIGSVVGAYLGARAATIAMLLPRRTPTSRYAEGRSSSVAAARALAMST